MLWASLSPTLGSEGVDLGTGAQIAAKVLPGGNGAPGPLSPGPQSLRTHLDHFVESESFFSNGRSKLYLRCSVLKKAC